MVNVAPPSSEVVIARVGLPSAARWTFASVTSLAIACCSRAGSSTRTTSFHAGVGSTGPSTATRNSPPSGAARSSRTLNAVLALELGELAEPLGVVGAQRGEDLVGDPHRLLGQDAADGVGVRRDELERAHRGRRAEPRRDAPAVARERHDAAELALVGDALVLEDHVLHVAETELLGDLPAGAAGRHARVAAGEALDVGGEQPGHAVAVAAGDLGVERRRGEGGRRAARTGEPDDLLGGVGGDRAAARHEDVERVTGLRRDRRRIVDQDDRDLGAGLRAHALQVVADRGDAAPPRRRSR